MQIKFSIGDKVQDKDKEVGEILSFRVDSDNVWYTVTSKEVDLKRKEIIEGVKHLSQKEIKLYVEPKKK